MKTLSDYFSSYAEYHQSPGNKLTHYVGIPLIVFSLFGLLSKIFVLGQVDLGLVLWLVATIFYFRLDWKWAAAFAPISFLIYFASRPVSWKIHIALFIAGWILQGIGHYKYEKRSPAFLTNFSHLLIGPFWIFCRLCDVF